MITKEQIEAAHARIKPYIHKTPVLTSNTINSACSGEVYFKCENLQKIGAFKARGAFNFALQLTELDRANGLCTHSSGNHAQAVALAAKTLNTRAYIVMPSNAPSVKVEAVKSYGADISFCEPTLEAREETLRKVQNQTKAVFIPPYDHEWIIEGQATANKELLEEIPELDIVVAPVGGGGLLAGTSLSSQFYSNRIQVFGAEPEGASDAQESFRSGLWKPSLEPNTIADGLLTSLGKRNFRIIQELVSDILLANDEEIIQAMKTIWERMKLIIEPSSAVTLAVIQKNPQLFRNKKIGVILSGGNVDLSKSYF